jgi:molybdenum cofactor cytidylyltransferase
VRKTIWSLVLAAGASKRFGSAKAIASWGDGTLLSRTLETAHAAAGHNVMVVTGGHEELIKPYLQGKNKIFNTAWQEGRGASLAAGTKAILEQAPDVSMILVMLVDQPLVTPEHIEKLISAAVAQDRCALSHNGEDTGPPAAIPRRYFDMIWTLTGDEGLKTRLSGDQTVKIYAPLQMRDVDTPEDLEYLERYRAF